MGIHYISPVESSLEKLEEIISENFSLALSPESKQLIISCREYLDKKVLESKTVFYGINTGFGSLCNVSVSDNDLQQLQENLVRSHSCGVGDEIDIRFSKLILLLKIHALALGKSGVHLSTVEQLIYFYNNGIIPVIYQQGSLGASGDLAPLAHMSLALIGEGEVYYKGHKCRTKDVLTQLNSEGIHLKSKEGLALLNGTQFMSSHLADSVIRMNRLVELADLVAAVSIEAYDCRPEPFNEHLHKIRPHRGQQFVAANILNLLKDSEIFYTKKESVQDPYSFRCVPQVHGASRDVLEYVKNVITVEINSVTDNPTVFPDEDMILSGGNFHGQSLAMSCDFLAIAAAELGSISERRIYRLISGERGLPAFLVANPGLNSGFMIPQYTAASIVSQNKQLCTPASIDSISSSNEQEDHVSMGANAATKLVRVIDNLEKIIAIELFAAFQALEFRKELKTSKTIARIFKDFRSTIPYIENDVVMYDLINRSVQFIRDYKF